MPAVAVAPEPDPFQASPGADLYTRMREYLDWVVEAGYLTGAVIADDHGLVLAHRRGSELAASLTLAFRDLLPRVTEFLLDRGADPRALRGHLTFEHEGRQWTTLWTPADSGTYYGVLISRSVPAGKVLSLAQTGLQGVFAD